MWRWKMHFISQRFSCFLALAEIHAPFAVLPHPPPCFGTDIYILILPVSAMLLSSKVHAGDGSSYVSFCSGFQLHDFQGLWKGCHQRKLHPSSKTSQGRCRCLMDMLSPQIRSNPWGGPWPVSAEKVLDRLAQEEQLFSAFCCLLRSQGS